ncbi:hypothetical protein BS47DRAFT_1362453 [Hydnum rufescens UP504]|uniref:Uncharacterized protein n=1 Tax=Hydnum rufescens UP504 TaxID=1448309 RepID=A0A9P6DX38_9AGAM|nr:hypothetical protein BS47DRAFT_1362453 [Hydnum rufescens UP504]
MTTHPLLQVCGHKIEACDKGANDNAPNGNTPNDMTHGNTPNNVTYGNAPNEDATYGNAPNEGPTNHTPAMIEASSNDESPNSNAMHGNATWQCNMATRHTPTRHTPTRHTPTRHANAPNANAPMTQHMAPCQMRAQPGQIMPQESHIRNSSTYSHTKRAVKAALFAWSLFLN